MAYWLMKSEPDVFGIDDLAKSPAKTTHWDGVRNFQARNFMRDEMRRGDLAFFYHSNCDEPGIAGIVKIVKEGYPGPHGIRRRRPALRRGQRSARSRAGTWSTCNCSASFGARSRSQHCANTRSAH